MTCTHLVVPGMVVEKIQKRPLKSISFDLAAVAKYMNEYRFKDVGAMTLLFQARFARILPAICSLWAQPFASRVLTLWGAGGGA